MLHANVKGTALASGATVLATWLAAAPAPRSGGNTPVLAQAVGQPAGPQVEDLGPAAERLARRVADVASFSAPARDLFRFRAAPPQKAAPRAERALVAVAPVTAAVAPAPPPFVLTGIAEDLEGGVVVRTAIIRGPRDLWLVKTGETVDGRFQVTSVHADAVEIVRGDTGATFRLAFRP